MRTKVQKTELEKKLSSARTEANKIEGSKSTLTVKLWLTTLDNYLTQKFVNDYLQGKGITRKELKSLDKIKEIEELYKVGTVVTEKYNKDVIIDNMIVNKEFVKRYTIRLTGKNLFDYIDKLTK